MTITASELKRAIGMPFTYKQKFQSVLSSLKSSNLVKDTLSVGEYALLDKYITSFVLCTPAMSFSSKMYAYQALELATSGLLSASSGVDSSKKEILNTALLSMLKFVGIEGETDYHFQIETAKAAEIILDVIQESGVVKFLVYDVGAGYLDSVAGDTGVDIAAAFESVDSGDNTIGGLVDIELSGGEVVEKEYTTTTTGSGFYVGQIIQIVDDGGSTLTQTDVALALVTEISA